MKTLVLNRRTLLRGAVGGAATALGLPTLEAMLNRHGDAYASGETIPKRFGVWFWGNGVRLDRWNPSSTGAGWRLSPELAPLEHLKPYINVVSGYRAKAGYGRRGHHDGCASLLSGIPFIELPSNNSPYSSKFGGPSIDQVAASRIAGDTLFPSVHVGVSKSVVRGEGPTLEFMSHRGPDQPIPSERNPQRVFDRIFGSFTPPDVTDPTNTLRVNILDAVKEDTRALKRKLGLSDQRRLDAHLQSIDQVQREIAALPPELTSACSVPTRPTEENVNMNGREPLQAVHDIMADLIGLAFACDLTRVATVMFTCSVGGTIYHDLGATRGHHELSHEPSEQDFIHRATHWNMQQFARLVQRLADIPEGDGSVLDNCAWLGTSDCSEGLSHSSNDYPMVIAGKAGGFLKYPGVHHRGSSDDNTSDVLLTLMRAVDAGISEVGAAQGYSNTPCAPIEA